MSDDVHDSFVDRAEKRVGTMLKDKWRLDALLGIGGMAAVYAATHRNGKRVAVKILHAELSVEGEVRQRFLREGYAANKVEHPGAVSVLDDDVADDGSVFLVMDLLEGESLAGRVERCGGTLEASEALVVADQLLDVLAAAHDKGIVHRDIKPDNVFVTRDGAVKVLDFGIARLREIQGGSGVTQTGLAMGTPAFMPPEQARGRWDEVGPRSDLWSVGATLYAVLGGRPPHVAETTNELLLAAMTLPARPIAELAPDLAPSTCHVVDRAVAYEQNARWPDARTMQAAVRAAYEELRGGPIEAAPRPTAPPRPVSASAPTMAAPSRPRPQLTTARAVSGIGAPTPPPAPRTSKRSAALAVVLAFALGGVGWAWVTGMTPASVARSAESWIRARLGEAPATVAATTEAAPPPAAPSSVPPPASTPVAANAVVATSTPSTIVPSVPPTGASSAPSTGASFVAAPSAAPAASSIAPPPAAAPSASAEAEADDEDEPPAKALASSPTHATKPAPHGSHAPTHPKAPSHRKPKRR